MLFSESKFRDPSTYASFYYPDEGRDTEYDMIKAKEEAQYVVEEDAAKLQKALQQNYPGATVTGIVGEITDEDVIDGRTDDNYRYKADVECYLNISIPKEVFAGKTDNEIFDLIPDINEIKVKLEIEYENDGMNDDVTDTVAKTTMTGQYKYEYDTEDYYADSDRDYYDPYY